MEYMILRHSDETTLENRVNELIRDGWRPSGGICVTHSDTGRLEFYLQAIVRLKSKGLGRTKPKRMANERNPRLPPNSGQQP